MFDPTTTKLQKRDFRPLRTCNCMICQDSRTSKILPAGLPGKMNPQGFFQETADVSHLQIL